jgi:signal transduction histidine kinase/CheY-like chemotaxis protein
MYWGVCPGTIQLFTDTRDKYAIETSNVSANKTRYIIRNFMDEEGYQERPYVAGWPFMRFYAEVPVRSPRGLVIGSYCVVDNKPRSEFSNQNVKVLEEIARSISQYLELIRMRLDYDRAVKLMTGLSSFVDNQRQAADARPRLPERTKSKQNRLKDVTDELNGIATAASATQAESFEQSIPQLQRESSEASTTESIKTEDTVASKVKQTFQRASNLIRESMDLDGCAFNDAYAIGMVHRSNLNRPFQGNAQLDSAAPASSGKDEEHSTLHHSHSNNNNNNNTPSSRHSQRSSESSCPSRAEPTCEILGYAEKATGSLTPSHPALSAVLLQELIKRYPLGHIFNVDKVELEDTASNHLHRRGSLHESPLLRKKRSKILSESAQLFSLFPRACSIIFFPLHDSTKNQWCAACLGWTSSPRRGLQNAELTYLAAFSNSIIAELGRLEAEAMGQAKIDFVANISHELRSPLHGILASAELLQESSTGTNQTELISMVDSCGRTLLDTMNHLLDYAKINNFAKQKGNGANSAPGSNSHENLGLVTDLDLRALVEEVVEAMFTGYTYQNRMAPEALVANGPHDSLDKISTNGKQPEDVVVFLDIEERSKWVFSSEAGAWRRLIMNVFGNSLKYTSTGSIKIQLQADEMKDTSGRTMVHLSVSDTGKGISKDYLKHKLYSPFSQEDSLAVGAGLGLSIVQQIVVALGGTVDIESEIKVGTTVTISIPLKAPAQSLEQPQTQSQQDSQSLQRFNGVTVCLLDFGEHSAYGNEANGASLHQPSGKSVLKSSLMKFLHGIPGLNVRSTNIDSIVPADIYLAEEADLAKLIESESSLLQLHRHFENARLILLRTDTSQTVPPEEGVVRLSQPFGPSKLKKALHICLDRRKAKMPLDLGRLLATKPVSDNAATVAKLTNGLPPISKNLGEGPPAEAPSEDAGGRPHLLLVDDNNINRKIMCSYMQKLKCSYATAADGLEAFEAYKRESASPERVGKKAFDFVFMDLSMPVMDGLTATHEIRAYEKEHKILPTQVVALTGLASTKSRDEALANGVNMYLTKPVQLKVLKSVIGLG